MIGEGFGDLDTRCEKTRSNDENDEYDCSN
jgi:hypothetical protein